LVGIRSEWILRERILGERILGLRHVLVLRTGWRVILLD
jgi:hypothetical protein